MKKNDGIVLAAFLLLAGFGSWFVLKHFDYQWTWNQIPQYFYTQEKKTFYAEEDGTIAIDSQTKEVVLETGTSKVTYPLKASGLKVNEGDRVFAGDMIGENEEAKAGPLVQGLWVTLSISFYSTLLGLLLGLICGLARISHSSVFSVPAMVYIEAIRGTPLLVQLFIIYFMFGSVLKIESRFLCGVLALGIFSGAYIGEILRSGIENIHYGQMVAARSLGMGRIQAMVHVILPQVFKNTLPAIAGTFISLIKDSSLVSVMALTDLTKAGREIVSSSFMVFETWLTVAVLYFLLTFIFSALFKKLERRLSIGGKR